MSSEESTKTTPPKQDNLERKLDEIRERTYFSRTSGGVQMLENALPVKKKRRRDAMGSNPSPSARQAVAGKSRERSSPSSEQASIKEKLRKIEVDKKQDCTETKPTKRPAAAAVYAAKMTKKSRNDLFLESLEGTSDQAGVLGNRTSAGQKSFGKAETVERTANRTVTAGLTDGYILSQASLERERSLIRPQVDHRFSDNSLVNYDPPTLPFKRQQPCNSRYVSFQNTKQVENNPGTPPAPVDLVRKGQSFIEVLDALATDGGLDSVQLKSPNRSFAVPERRQPPAPSPHSLNTNMTMTRLSSGDLCAGLQGTPAWSGNQFQASSGQYSGFQGLQINNQNYIQSTNEQFSSQRGDLAEDPRFRRNQQRPPSADHQDHSHPLTFSHTPHQGNTGFWNYESYQCEPCPPPPQQVQRGSVQHMWGSTSRSGKPGTDYPLGQSFIPVPRRKTAPKPDEGWFNQWM